MRTEGRRTRPDNPTGEFNEAFVTEACARPDADGDVLHERPDGVQYRRDIGYRAIEREKSG